MTCYIALAHPHLESKRIRADAYKKFRFGVYRLE